jgi:hypothetical protein
MYRMKGDHRAYFFDTGEEVIFDNKQEPVYKPDGRSFSSKDPNGQQQTNMMTTKIMT